MEKRKPKFIMLVGLPGSGKTTFAIELSKKIRNTIILSSDIIRAELFGDERIQAEPERVFARMSALTKEYLNKGVNVIYDATNIQRKHRVHLLSQLPPCEKIAQIVFAKYETCIEQDKQRERTVGEHVIRRMLLNFQIPYYDEGWNRIEIHNNSEKYNEKDYADWVDCVHDNPHHPNTVYQHTRAVIEETKKHIPINPTDLDGARIAIILMLVATLHDVGKKFTKSFINSKGEKTEVAHYYGHHNVGAYFALGYNRLDKLEMDMREKMLVLWMVNSHMEPFFNSKYYRNLNKGHRELLDAFHACDVAGA